MDKLIHAIYLSIVLVISGCGGGGSTNTKSLKLIEQSSTTSLPALVIVKFKVESSKGDPVVGLTLVDNFSLFENGDPISNAEAIPVVAPDPSDFIFSSLLLLDMSGSILIDSFDELKEASKAFINQTILEDNPGNKQMKIAFFDGNQNITDLTAYLSNRASLLSAIDNLTKDVSTDNSTNLNGAIVQGIQDVENKIQSEQTGSVIAAGSLVLFTDGRDQAGRTPRSTALAAVDSADENLSIFTIGLNGEIDRSVLKSFGKDGFQEVDDITALADSFETVAQLTNDEANSYYVLKYCSPKRGGVENELEIKVTSGSLKGSIKYSFSAVGFSGGCTVN